MDYETLTEEIKLLKLQKLEIENKIARLTKEREQLTVINTNQIRLDGL